MLLRDCMKQGKLKIVLDELLESRSSMKVCAVTFQSLLPYHTHSDGHTQLVHGGDRL